MSITYRIEEGSIPHGGNNSRTLCVKAENKNKWNNLVKFNFNDHFISSDLSIIRSKASLIDCIIVTLFKSYYNKVAVANNVFVLINECCPKAQEAQEENTIPHTSENLQKLIGMQSKIEIMKSRFFPEESRIVAGSDVSPYAAEVNTTLKIALPIKIAVDNLNMAATKVEEAYEFLSTIVVANEPRLHPVASNLSLETDSSDNQSSGSSVTMTPTGEEAGLPEFSAEINPKMQQIDRVLEILLNRETPGIESKIARAQAKLRELTGCLRLSQQEMVATKEREYKPLVEKINAAKAALADSQGRIEEAQYTMTRAKAKLSAAQAGCETLDRTKPCSEAEKKALTSAKLSAMESLQTASHSFSLAEARFTVASKAFVARKLELEGFERDMHGLQKPIRTLHAKIQNIRNEIEAVEADLEALRTNKAEIERKITVLEAAKLEIKRARA